MQEIEIFFCSFGYCPKCASLSFKYDEPTTSEAVCQDCNDGTKVPLNQTGWFYWFCQPGCLPDSEPFGPFSTAEEAEDDANYDLVDDDGIAHGYTDEDDKLHGD